MEPNLAMLLSDARTCRKVLQESREMDRLHIRGIFNQDCVADYSQPCPRNHVLTGEMCVARKGFVKTTRAHHLVVVCRVPLRCCTNCTSGSNNGPTCELCVTCVSFAWVGRHSPSDQTAASTNLAFPKTQNLLARWFSESAHRQV